MLKYCRGSCSLYSSTDTSLITHKEVMMMMVTTKRKKMMMMMMTVRGGEREAK